MAEAISMRGATRTAQGANQSTRKLSHLGHISHARCAKKAVLKGSLRGSRRPLYLQTGNHQEPRGFETKLEQLENHWSQLPDSDLIPVEG